AGALLAAGVKDHGAARNGAPRGYYCGMGVCHDCSVEVEATGTVRACLAKAAPGMVVSRGAGKAAPQPAPPPGPAMTAEETIDIDVLVVGAGPAGLAAAIAASQAGAAVMAV